MLNMCVPHSTGEIHPLWLLDLWTWFWLKVGGECLFIWLRTEHEQDWSLVCLWPNLCFSLTHQHFTNIQIIAAMVYGYPFAIRWKKEKRICLPCLPGCKGCRRPYKGSCFRTSRSPEEEFVVVVILGIMVAQINTRTEHTIDVSPTM